MIRVSMIWLKRWTKKNKQTDIYIAPRITQVPGAIILPISLHLSSCPKKILKNVTSILHDLGEISGKTIFIDGTKIESCANKYTFVWKNPLQSIRLTYLKSSRRILVFSNMSQPAGSSACFSILCSQGIFHMSVQGAQYPLPFSYSAGLRGRSYTGTANIDSCA